MQSSNPDYTYELKIDFTEVWRTYLALKNLWPEVPARQKGLGLKEVGGLEEAAKDYDVLLLDGYGVLNKGADAVPGMTGAVKRLQESGKHVFVLTNGASFPIQHTVEKYMKLGYSFELSNVISSRDALVDFLVSNRKEIGRWGVVGTNGCREELLGAAEMTRIEQKPELLEECDGLILLSSQGWSPDKNNTAIHILQKKSMPILVGNPDVGAPFQGWFSTEPGYYAYHIWRETGLKPEFFGKPFPAVYRYATERIRQIYPDYRAERTLMVGDTPQTDILGGLGSGMGTLLMTGHGLLTGQPHIRLLEECGIQPDFILTR